jgi:hypothetical protein
MSAVEFREHPFQAKTLCCGAMVYGRAADMPADYKAKPNHTERIPHLDGTVGEYAYFIADGAKDKRGDWFCSAGELWRKRLTILFDKVVPNLASAALFSDDAAAATQLCAILDRLAEVFPGMPLYHSGTANGFTRGKDGIAYLTQAEYDAAPRPCLAGNYAPWSSTIDNPGKLGFSGWTDHTVCSLGELAEAVDIVRFHPASRAFGQTKYGNPDAWWQKVDRGLVQEMVRLCDALPNTRGNTILWWCAGAIKLGIEAQAPHLLDEAFWQFESNAVNGYFSDGLSEQGAFNYAGMMRGLVSGLDLVRLFGAVDITRRYPFFNTIRGQSDNAVITLHGIESQHSDEHAGFFGARVLAPVKEIKYGDHERSQHFPEYGLTCVRGGAPGSRLEAIFDYQTTVAHSHPKMNLQFFYEGINLLPDLGYGCVSADPATEPYKSLDYAFPLLPLPLPDDSWGSWTWTLAYKPEAHVGALVDGQNDKQGPCTFLRYLGGQGLDHPAYQAQFVDVDGRGIFNWASATKTELASASTGKMDRCRRQVAVITLPNGRAVLLDLYRLRGGQRHDVVWHVPAAHPTLAEGALAPLASPSLKEYLEKTAAKGVTTGTAFGFMQEPRRLPLAGAGQDYRAEWQISPARYLPRNGTFDEAASRWKELHQEVRLRLWGHTAGSVADSAELLSSLGPWPSGVMQFEPPARKVVALKNAMNYLVESRQASAGNLDSVFAHLYEPAVAGQAPAVEAVRFYDTADGAATLARITWKDAAGASQELDAVATHSAASTTLAGTAVEGRFALADSPGLNLLLYDGSRLEKGGVKLQLEPSWQTQIVGFVGDLSGNPAESALIVESARPLPCDGRLVGHSLTVHHQMDDWHTTGYTIDNVSAAGGNRYRIDLRGKPPFYQHKLYARRFSPDRLRVNSTTWLYKGMMVDHYQGRRIVFPRTGFTCGIRGAPPNFDPWHGDELVLERPLPPEVQVGDEYRVHTIQAGDAVVIPSLFATKASPAPDGTRLVTVFATAGFTLELPAGTQVLGRRQPDATTETDRKGASAITLKENECPGGTVVLRVATDVRR